MDTGSDALLAISCPLKFAARSGTELCVDWVGADKSQRHWEDRQQSIGCDCPSAQGVDKGWQDSAYVGLPLSKSASNTVRSLRAERNMDLTLCAHRDVVKKGTTGPYATKYRLRIYGRFE